MLDSHIRFSDKYFETLNASESAIYAGFSVDTARQQGWQLLQREDVQEYLSKLKAEASEKTGVSKERWLKELAELGFSNIQDFIETNNTIKDISSIDRSKASSVSSIKKTVTEGDFGIKEVVEFKLHDKLNALDKLGRHLGFFEKDNEQSKLNISMPIINIIKPTDDKES